MTKSPRNPHTARQDAEAWKHFYEVQVARNREMQETIERLTADLALQRAAITRPEDQPDAPDHFESKGPRRVTMPLWELRVRLAGMMFAGAWLVLGIRWLLS